MTVVELRLTDGSATGAEVVAAEVVDEHAATSRPKAARAARFRITYRWYQRPGWGEFSLAVPSIQARRLLVHRRP